MTLLDQIERHEGRRRTVYFDSLGVPTIGVGRNIRDKGLSEDEIDYLLQNDVRECLADLVTFPWFDALDNVRQNVLIDMRFQLGAAGFRKFKGTLAAVASGDYVKAGDHMQASLWARQVPTRAKTLIRMMKTGAV